MIFTFGLANFPRNEQVLFRFAQNKNTYPDLLKYLANWDGGHFLSIAQFGYREKFQYAFFPLYPVAINFVNQVTNNYLIAALLISIFSTFLTLHLLFSLLAADFSRKLAERAVVFLLIFPTSFYLITAYSESFFLLLVVASFYFMRKKRLVLAMVFAALASATRLAGLAVAAALIVQVVTNGERANKNWFIFLAPLGFIFYCIYLFQQTGDPFYFLAAEGGNWQRNLAMPGLSFWETLKSLTRPGFLAGHFNNFLELLFAVFGLGMVIRTFRFLPAGYAIYGLLSILFPLFTQTLLSIPRFLLPIFPIFILLALAQDQRVNFLVNFVSVSLLCAFSILFINGYWVS